MVASPPPSGSSTNNGPDAVTRIGAALIDGLVASVLSMLLMGAPFLGSLVSSGYLLVRDGVKVGALRHQSVGKYVMGLDVVRIDGKPMNVEVSIQRNWMFGLGAVTAIVAVIPGFGHFLVPLVSIAAFGLVAYETYNVLVDPAGQRWGDRLGHTKVVEAEQSLL